jgi:multimeric flavodoxin WrbA
MKVLVINGNTKTDGFIAGALDIVASYLEKQGVEVRKIRLADARINECLGCFHCLRTGECVQRDDMDQIVTRMQEADGFVVGSPVRNGLTTACYKRFYERITYTLGFPLLLEDKHTLAISCVGATGGKGVNKKLLCLQDVCHTRLSDFIFCTVGIPTKIDPSEIKDKLKHSTDKLIGNIKTHRSKRPIERITGAVDRAILRRFLFEKAPIFTHTS